MLHLLKYNLKVKLKNFGMTFWPLAFPLILGTLFYFAFGNISDADFQTVPVAVVEEAHADQVFLAFLDQIEGGEDKLLSVEKMTDEQAQDKLEAKKVSGIYYVGTEPSLTVASSGIEESILQSVLSSYENTEKYSEKYVENPSGRNLRWTSGYAETAKQRSGTFIGRQDHRWKRAVFLCTDCHGMSLRMFHRGWHSHQITGKSYSSGSQKMRHSYP